MDQAQALSMAADNPNFPGWLRDACRVASIHMVSAAAEVERLRAALRELLDVESLRQHLQAEKAAESLEGEMLRWKPYHQRRRESYETALRLMGDDYCAQWL